MKNPNLFWSVVISTTLISHNLKSVKIFQSKTLDVNQSGIYSVTIMDENGCEGGENKLF